jgi:hypothetical protein
LSKIAGGMHLPQPVIAAYFIGERDLVMDTECEGREPRQAEEL